MMQTLCARTFLTGLCGLLAVAVLPSLADADKSGHSEWVNACADWDERDKPGPPFRIHANSWYVGTCGIAAILIDGGTAAGADPIAANIGALGFRIEDVKILLMSHEHFDHVGGLAEPRRRSGGYRFSDHPEYVAAFRAGLNRLSELECTILLTPHPSASALRNRLASDAGLVDATACKSYAASISERLDTRLAEEPTDGHSDAVR